MDITDELPVGAPGGGWEDEVKEWLQDEGLLSYLDQLCSQEDFVTQVRWLADPDPPHPRGWCCSRLMGLGSALCS